MTGRTHVAIGVGSVGLALAAAAPAGLTLSVPALGLCALLAGAGALAPDLDHGGSTVSKRLPRRLMARALTVLALLLVAARLVSAGMGRGAADGLWATMAPLTRITVWAIGAAMALVGASLLLRVTFGHRGPTHSLLAAVVASVTAAALASAAGLDWWLGVAFGWGWLTHVLADATTPKGARFLLWPLRMIS